VREVNKQKNNRINYKMRLTKWKNSYKIRVKPWVSQDNM